MVDCVNSPSFLWRIQNFTSVQESMSPALRSFALVWQLRFSRFMEDGSEKIRLILECLNVSEALATFEFKVAVSFVLDDGSLTLLKNGKYSLKNKEWHIWTETSSNFHTSYNDYLERITFRVTVMPVGGFESLCEHQMNVNEDYPEFLCMKSLSEDLEDVFNNDEHSDFVLKCGEKSFYVHKAILSARSEFFAGMFRSNMKESNEGTGKIEHLEPDILELVLRYLYTGKVPELSRESLKKVYAAADRFGVETLKVKCYTLFIDSFLMCPEQDTLKETEKEPTDVNKEAEVVKSEPTDVNKESEVVKPESSKERQLLKDLLMSREWRSFSHEFPYKSQGIWMPYLLQD